MKRPIKKTKRFDSGGYTGDDPIVKYRMGKSSESETYDAMGQKDLADAARAKETPKETTKKEVVSTPVTEKSDNFYETSSEKDIADASFKTPAKKETTPVKTVTPKGTSVVKDKAGSNSYAALKKLIPNEPENYKPPPTPHLSLVNKAGTNPKQQNVSPELDSGAYKDIKKSETKKKPNLKNGPINLPPMIKSSLNDSESYDKTMKNIEKEKTDKNEMSYPAIAMKKGGKIKKMAKGGTVKRSSASKRADGCAIRGKTRA